MSNQIITGTGFAIDWATADLSEVLRECEHKLASTYYDGRDAAKAYETIERMQKVVDDRTPRLKIRETEEKAEACT